MTTGLKLLITTATYVLIGKLHAQEPAVSGQLISGPGAKEEKPFVADAVLQLLAAADSSLVKTEISGEDGRFTFRPVKPGAYLLQVNALNYLPYSSGVFTVSNNLELGTLSLTASGVTLKEVTISTRKPYIERQNGKVVLNVENSINAAGSSAFEIIEKAPGVRVDNTDEVSLNGRPGTAIWIDGKPTPMTGSDLANYLRGIPSSAIDKVEIIANPSSRYDAAGSSIINIIMKKDKRVGTNGSLSLSYGQGVYPKSNNSISLNHRNKKVNVYGSYNYAKRQVFSRLRLRREFSERDSFIGAFDQDNYFKYDFNTHVARAGVDYYINKKNTIGFMLNGVSNVFHPIGTNVSQVYNASNIQSSVFTTNSKNSNERRNLSANVNYRHDFDSAGTSLVTDLDAATYQIGSMQNIETRYLDLSYNETRMPYVLYGDLSGKLDIYAVKNDFSATLRKDYKLEAGQKSSYVVADNKLSFYDRSNSLSIYDTSKSNHFIYTENINAAYLNVSREFKKWSLRAGLRAEHTLVTGEQLVYNSTFRSNYAQLFPSALISYKLSETSSLELNYSRRIRRPGYEQLNPFKFYLDPSTYREGNPYLQPSTTESFELTHTFRQQMSLSLGFGRTFNNIIEVIAPLTNEQRVTVQTNRNLSMVDVYTLNGSIPYEIRTWWHSSNNFNVYYASYSGNVANTPIAGIGNLTGSFNTVNTFNFSPTLSAELSANYQAREVYAFDVIDPIWSVNIGMQKKIWNNKATLRFNVNDVFYSNRIRAQVKFTGYNETFLVVRDSRVATISFSYKFGKHTVPGARRRQGGAEDVKERANGVG